MTAKIRKRKIMTLLQKTNRTSNWITFIMLAVVASAIILALPANANASIDKPKENAPENNDASACVNDFADENTKDVPIYHGHPYSGICKNPEFSLYASMVTMYSKNLPVEQSFGINLLMGQSFEMERAFYKTMFNIKNDPYFASAFEAQLNLNTDLYVFESCWNGLGKLHRRRFDNILSYADLDRNKYCNYNAISSNCHKFLDDRFAVLQESESDSVPITIIPLVF